MSKELDFASGYFTVFPGGFVHTRNPEWPEKEPYLFIGKDCPPDIRERLLEEWPKVKAATKKRHEKGLYTSKDYFV